MTTRTRKPSATELEELSHLVTQRQVDEQRAEGPFVNGWSWIDWSEKYRGERSGDSLDVVVQGEKGPERVFYTQTREYHMTGMGKDFCDLEDVRNCENVAFRSAAPEVYDEDRRRASRLKAAVAQLDENNARAHAVPQPAKMLRSKSIDLEDPAIRILQAPPGLQVPPVHPSIRRVERTHSSVSSTGVVPNHSNARQRPLQPSYSQPGPSNRSAVGQPDPSDRPGLLHCCMRCYIESRTRARISPDSLQVSLSVGSDRESHTIWRDKPCVHAPQSLNQPHSHTN